MRTLFTNFHQGYGGGHDTYITNLLAGLADSHEVTVAAPRGSRLFRLARAHAGVRLQPIDFSPRGLAWLREVWALWLLISFGQFDVIHVNGSADHRLIMLVRFIALSRPPIVYTKHNDHRSKSFGNWLRARLGTDHVIAVSDYVARRLKESPYRRVPVTTVAHGVDVQHFSPVAADSANAMRRHYFGPASETCTVFVSTAGTNYEKGWTDLLEAMAQLPGHLRRRVRVLLAGEAPLPCMVRKVESLGLANQVLFTGLLDDVRPALAAADAAFVLSRTETLSFACREAMAMGLPVLVSDAGGLPENVRDGIDGWITPSANIAQLKAKVEQILSSPLRSTHMGRAAAEKSRKTFGLDTFVEQTLAVYGSVIRTRPLPESLEPSLSQIVSQ